MNHKYITCTGFGGTGSSVISDLMQEFDNVKSCGSDFEMSMAFDIGGVSDLQHYLVDDFERHKVSEGLYMFKRYIDCIKPGYKHYLGEDFEKIIDAYIKDLVLIEWQGENHMQHFRYDNNKRWFYYYFIPRIQNKLRKWFLHDDGYEHSCYLKKLLPMEITVLEQDFYEKTQRMFGAILDLIDLEDVYDYLCFDQLVPPYHIDRYAKYFPNLKVVVVDRDPRDLYLLNELYWHEAWIPSFDINTFIKWFKELRRNTCHNCENVMIVKFEDTIYRYDDVIPHIITFLELDDCHQVYKKKFFNPNKSMQNTRLWEKTDRYKLEIGQIAECLNSYCYKY